MKILHVIEAWQGGIASYVSVLALEQQQRGHEIFILADQKEFLDDVRSLDGINIVYYASSRSLAKVAKVARIVHEKINKIQPDIVHCHSSFPGVYCRLYSSTVPIIYTPHSWSFLKRDSGVLKKLLYKIAEKYLSKNTHSIMCMSTEETVEAYQLGIARDKIKTIYTGIKDTKYKKISDNTEQIKVGFFGRLDYQKGFDVLKGSFAFLSPNIQIHIFGDYVRAKPTEPVENSNSVVYHGWVSSEKIPTYLSEMDIVIAPSRWEGLALTLLESMRAGRGIIVTNNSSLPEVVINTFNGLVLEQLTPVCIAETVNGLTKDECKNMGENARLVYERTFDFNIFYDNLMAVYSDAKVNT